MHPRLLIKKSSIFNITEKMETNNKSIKREMRTHTRTYFTFKLNKTRLL